MDPWIRITVGLATDQTADLSLVDARSRSGEGESVARGSQTLAKMPKQARKRVQKQRTDTLAVWVGHLELIYLICTVTV